ncbi:hypothetical protein QQM79_14385 [Marinobacteraceae bacterium S3BR75-40.1]
MASESPLKKSPLAALWGKRRATSPRRTAHPLPSTWDHPGFEIDAMDALRTNTLGSANDEKRPVTTEASARLSESGPSRPRNALFIKELTTPLPLLDDEAESALYPEAFDPMYPDPAFTPKPHKSLGVFSDSTGYSALIKQELAAHELFIRYFHRTSTFTPERYPLFDEVAAWIVFLSEDDESDFMERFLERYAEKPTLFIFEHNTRHKTAAAIARFVTDNALDVPETPDKASEGAV